MCEFLRDFKVHLLRGEGGLTEFLGLPREQVQGLVPQQGSPGFSRMPNFAIENSGLGHHFPRLSFLCPSYPHTSHLLCGQLYEEAHVSRAGFLETMQWVAQETSREPGITLSHTQMCKNPPS